MDHYKRKNLLSHINVGGKNTKFGVIKIKNGKLHYCLDTIIFEDVDTDKILLSNRVSSKKEN